VSSNAGSHPPVQHPTARAEVTGEDAAALFIDLMPRLTRTVIAGMHGVPHTAG